MSAAEAGIIGYGTAKYDKRPRQTLFGYLAEAAREALASAGVHKDELDGLAIDVDRVVRVDERAEHDDVGQAQRQHGEAARAQRRVDFVG